ncbi:MAG: hypothetical protein HC888_05835 [Candidatus Competibacteraceae bacterium]|nr:hypothetical protein [Candidatus Competibacteraceae bacterium]
MQLATEEVKIHRSEEFAEEEFGIGDVSIILDILRKRMYSNPIRTICQEIMSNARDAHREVGKPELPIEVHLPTFLSSNFVVRDFGPGISPDRMKNIFIKYGASTKHTDNKQTGGFGIGAKTPWAYHDSFGIVSITPEADDDGNQVLVRRQYVAYIDETKVGRLICADKRVTNEPQGTAIVIDSKKNDFDEFQRWTIEVSRYWTPRPKILGGNNAEFPDSDVMVESDRFVILNESDYQFGKVPFAIVDGIPYPLPPTAYRSAMKSDDEQSLFSMAIGLKFATGEVPLAATREQIDFERSTTKDAVVDHIREVIPVLRQMATEDIAAAPNLLEARRIFGMKYKNFSFLRSGVFWTSEDGKVKMEIKRNSIDPTHYNTEVFRYVRNCNGRLSVKKANNIECWDSTVLVIDNSGDKLLQPSRGRVYAILDKLDKENRENITVYVLQPANERTAVRRPEWDDEEWEEAQRRAADFNKATKALFENEHIDLYGTLYLADFPKIRMPSATRGATGGTKRNPVARLRRFDIGTGDFLPEEDFDPETDEVEGFYVELYNRSAIYNGGKMDNGTIRTMLRWYAVHKKDVILYGIPRRFIGKVMEYGELTPFENLIEEERSLIKADRDYGKNLPNSRDVQSALFQDSIDEDEVKKLLKLIHNSKGPIFQYVAMQNKLVNAKERVRELLERAHTFNLGWYCTSPDNACDEHKEARKAIDEVRRRYPLLSIIRPRYDVKADLKELAFYINAKDEIESLTL